MLRRTRANRLADVGRIAVHAAREGLESPSIGARLGVGHDLVYLPDFAPHLAPRFVERAYTPAEAAYCADASDPLPYFAARWAAKEAAYKAFSELAAAFRAPAAGLTNFRCYEVVHEDGLAVPRLRLHGAAERLMAELSARGPVTTSLSLTHERDYAAAFVVLAVVVPVRGARKEAR